MNGASDMPRVGIAGVAVEIGNLRISSDEVSRITDIAKRVVEDKMGIREIYRWGPDPGPDAQVVRACSRALAGLDPCSLDMIVTLVHPTHAEMEVYGYGTLLKDKLGAQNAEVLEISDTCASSCLALQMVRELMAAERDIRRVLVVGLMITLDSVDIANPRTSFLANLSDGTGAMLVVRDDRDELDTVVLESAHVTDPQFVEDMPLTSPYVEEVATMKKRYRGFLPRRVDITDKDSFKQRLDPVTYPAYVGVIHEALERSGFKDDEVDLVGANTMKPSLWKSILENFKLEPATQLYLREGHVAYLDQYLYIMRIREERRFPRGGVIVLTSAGMGFHWAATCLAFKGPKLRGRLP